MPNPLKPLTDLTEREASKHLANLTAETERAYQTRTLPQIAASFFGRVCSPPDHKPQGAGFALPGVPLETTHASTPQLAR